MKQKINKIKETVKKEVRFFWWEIYSWLSLIKIGQCHLAVILVNNSQIKSQPNISLISKVLNMWAIIDNGRDKNVFI